MLPLTQEAHALTPDPGKYIMKWELSIPTTRYLTTTLRILQT